VLIWLVCITCFQNGAFAWAARDLTPEGTKLQGRPATKFLPNHRPCLPYDPSHFRFADTSILLPNTPIVVFPVQISLNLLVTRWTL